MVCVSGGFWQSRSHIVLVCLMLSVTDYAQNYAGIANRWVPNFNKPTKVFIIIFTKILLLALEKLVWHVFHPLATILLYALLYTTQNG